MANTTLQTSLIARAAVTILENELMAARLVYRGHEAEFGNTVNGYEPGDTISIRKPTDFTVRSGATMSVQDVVEGKTTITVDQQKGIDFQFTSKELTLDIKTLSERVIRPAMIQLVNDVESSIMSLYSTVPNWVGTPGQTINSFSDFSKAPERMDEMAVPRDGDRCVFMSPADYYGMLNSQTGLQAAQLVQDAYRNGKLPNLAGIMPYMTQNAPTHTTGAFAGTVLIDGSITSATTTYASVKDTNTQTIHIDGLTAATATIKKGDVFTIDSAYDVNPVTKAQLPHLKQFVVMEDATASANEVDLVVSPALIWSGPFQNVKVVGVSDLDNQAVTFMGTQKTAYRQNIAFHKNAFSLAMVPLISPPGAVDVSRQSKNGVSVRMIPVYDGTNDIAKYRLDILYGVKAVDPRLAVRVSGTA